nr:phosphate transporter PHO1-like [Physcomitrium patens]|eukprot:XP_024403762.1 phosphate transporter PHO1-like [Physcomitrella patens]
MVKFSKQLEGSLVPEWKGAYCNYKGLKRDVNRIKQDRLEQASGRRSSFGHLRSLGSLSKFNSIGTRIKRTATGLTRGCDEREPEIVGFFREQNGCMKSLDICRDLETTALCDTDLVELLGHAEQDKIFFNHLDSELEKIDRFYKIKEAEYIARAGRLEKQLLAFFEVHEALARQNLKLQTFSFIKSKGGDADSSVFGYESPLLEVITMQRGDQALSKEANRFQPENEPSVGEERCASSSTDEEMEIIANFIENVNVTETQDSYSVAEVAIPVEDDSGNTPPWFTIKGNSIESSPRHHSACRDESDGFNVVAESPSLVMQRNVKHDREQKSSIRKSKKTRSNIIQDMIDISFRKKKVQSSEKMLRSAFIEFYRGLGLLKSYSSLNMVAFAKIMKKYDKVVKHKLGPVYIREVERSYFATSDTVTKLMTKVEEIFTKHFADHDRRKAMRQLRPIHQHGGHSITFLLGIFTGVAEALLVGFLILLFSAPEYRTVGGHNYIDSVFHVFSTLGLVLLHRYMYGWNVYSWQRVRINYPFICEFAPGTELRYREVFLVCTSFTSLLLGAMIVHIIASTKQAPLGIYTPEFAPMAISSLFIVSVCSPANILYRSSRMFFLCCLKRVILAPFYTVILADFFLGDQLTSQVSSFRNLEFIICYYLGGYFEIRDEDACTQNKTFQGLIYVFSLLPYSFRFWQCLRRWRDEGDTKQLYNAGKYASAMMAVGVRVTYSMKEDTTWLVLFILFSCFATFYQLYWDIVVDWGLLQKNSKNKWLRDNLIFRKKYIYFVSMGVNTVLRLAWVSSIQHLNYFPGFSQAGWYNIFASLEVIRRGHWNFNR